MMAVVIVIPGSVSCKSLWGVKNGSRRRALLRELDSLIEGVIRPRLVLDCSDLEHIGAYEMRLLVECLERVMVRNGDAKLAAVSPQVKGSLARIGVDRLFRIYDSREGAISSFASLHEFTSYGDDLAGRVKLHSIEQRNAYPSSTLR